MRSLTDAILQEDLSAIKKFIHYGEDLNELDEYGFTPLIESAIVNNTEISSLLLTHGADPNQQDVTGGTALHWAAENNNIKLCKLLLTHHANPNAYNFAGQSVLVMPLLRQQNDLKQVLIAAGADLLFAQDYINTKLLGHLFELIGTATIVSPDHQFVEVDFEGFYLEVTLGLIADSLLQFQNHFAARELRRYFGIAQFIVKIIQQSFQLIKYQQYRIDVRQYESTIHHLLSEEPLLIPVGYEGHAITFIKFGDIWVKCDRREDSRLYDNIVYYRVRYPNQLTNELIKNLIYSKQSYQFINQDLDILLGLEPIAELKIETQISGNCSWANVEASIPALFFLLLMHFNQDVKTMPHYKTIALHFFHRFREWNKDRALHLCIESFKESDALRKASKAEILATILFQYTDKPDKSNKNRIDSILSLLFHSPY